MDRYDELAALTAASRVPIAGGELHSAGLPELAMMVERRCYHVFQPDAVFAGGIARPGADRLCREHKLGYSPHTWTNGIGFAINLQLFAASGFADERELEFPIAPPDGRSRLATASSPSPSCTSAASSRLRRAWPRLRGGSARAAAPRPPLLVMDRKRLAWFSIRTRGIKVSKEIDRVRRQRLSRPSTG